MLSWGSPLFAEGVPQEEVLSGEARVVSVLEKYVLRRSPAPEGADIRIRLVNPADWDGLLRAEDRLVVKESPRGGLPGRANFLVAVERRDGEVLSRWVTADVEVVRSVVTAKYALRPFRVIESGDVEVKRVYLSRGGAHYAVQPEEVVGKKARKSVEVGAPITLDMLQDVPVMRQGDRVTLVVETDGFQIMAAGEAKGEGFLGKQVPVINIDSKRVVYGKVLDATMVQVGGK